MTNYQVSQESVNIRIDKFLMEHLNDISRSQLQQYIKQGFVLVNGVSVKANYKVQLDDNIELNLDAQITQTHEILPQDIKLDIVYEDNDIIVVNKPKQMVTHPAPGHYSDTLVNALMHHTDQLSSINGDMRPGIVHRLDQDTTGLILICKNNEAHQLVSEAMKIRGIKRYYKALVVGEMKEDYGTIDAPIGRGKHDRMKMYVTSENSKEARTHFKVIQRFEGYTLVECELDTGRTHQIRVHLNYIGFPIFGDNLYGNKRDMRIEGQFLHAYRLEFDHPITKNKIELEIEMPQYFIQKLETLVKKEG